MKISNHIIITTTLCSALAGLTGGCDSEGRSPARNLTRLEADTDPGGTEGELSQDAPWLVSIQRVGPDGSHWCSGAIISDEWVLTAAHCVEDKLAPSLQVLAGIDRLGDPAAEETIRGVQRIVLHPDYARRRLGHDHDLALLQLDAPLDVSRAEVSAIELGTLDDLEPTTSGAMGVVSGWGELSSGDDPDARQVVSVELLSNAEAREAYGTPLVSSQLASRPMEGMETCQADSGGPLVLESGQEPRLVGVATEGTGCADPSAAQVYTRVSSYLEWIDAERGRS